MRGCFLLTLLLLLGCTRPRTQMVLCLGTDMSQPDTPSVRSTDFAARIEQVCGLPSLESDDVNHRLESVRIELRTPEGEISRSWDIRLASPEDPARNQMLLPRDLAAIEPRDGDESRRVLVRVIGHVTSQGMSFDVTRDTIASFTPGKTMRISVFLPSACIGVTCPTGQTCGEGGTCVSNASLVPIEIPSQPTIEVEAGAPKDAFLEPDEGVGSDSGVDIDADLSDVDETGIGPVLGRDVPLYEDVRDSVLGQNDPFSGCRPFIGRGTDVGGRCRNLAEAWTAREINVGYFPFRATQGALLHYTETEAVRIDAGELIALSSVATNYSPVCDLAMCSDSTWSCATHSPPLAPGIQDDSGTWYFWGYHLQPGNGVRLMGWIRTNPRSLVFVGNARRTCAFGPSADGGVDFEATARNCGAPDPMCYARGCGQQNHCDEGNDDCGSRCGASVPPPLSGEPVRRVTHTEGDQMASWGAYLLWAQGSTPKTWLPYGTEVRVLFRNLDRSERIWDFIEVRTGSRFAPAGLRGWVRDAVLQ